MSGNDRLEERFEVYTISNVPVNYQFLAKSECESGTLEMQYQWDNGEIISLNNTSEIALIIPGDFELGSQHILMIRSISREYMDSGKNFYLITIVDAEEEFLSVGIKKDEIFLNPNAQYNFSDDDLIEIVVNSNASSRIEYSWNDLNETVIHSEQTLQFVNSRKSETKSGVFARAIGESGTTDWLWVGFLGE